MKKKKQGRKQTVPMMFQWRQPFHLENRVSWKAHRKISILKSFLMAPSQGWHAPKKFTSIRNLLYPNILLFLALYRNTRLSSRVQSVLEWCIKFSNQLARTNVKVNKMLIFLARNDESMAYPSKSRKCGILMKMACD